MTSRSAKGNCPTFTSPPQIRACVAVAIDEQNELRTQVLRVVDSEQFSWFQVATGFSNNARFLEVLQSCVQLVQQQGHLRRRQLVQGGRLLRGRSCMRRPTEPDICRRTDRKTAYNACYPKIETSNLETSNLETLKLQTSDIDTLKLQTSNDETSHFTL